MLKRTLLAGAIALALCGCAGAQTYKDSSGNILTGVVPVAGCPVGGGTCTGGSISGSGGGGGAVTAAAGSYSAGSLVDIINLTGTKAAGTAATNSLLGGLIYNSSPITLTTGQQAALQSDTNGYLNVHIQAGAGSGGTALPDNSAFTQSTTNETPFGCLYNTGYAAATSGRSTIARCDSSGQLILGAGSSTIGALTANQSVNTAQVNGVTTLTGAGATGTGAQRVGVAQDTTTIAGSAPGTAGAASANVVTVQGVASMTAVKTDGSAVTQPVSAASLPLPTGASTSANQSTEITSLGTIATNTGLLATDAHLTRTQGVIGAATAPTNMDTVGGVYNSSPLTLTTGQSAALQADANGYLNVHIQAGAGGGTASSFGSAYPATGTAAGAEYLSSPPTLTTGQMVALQTDVNGNLKVNVNNANANGQTTMSASSPVAIASDQSAIPIKGGAANGSAVSGNPNLVAGSDGTNARTLLTKSDGTILAQLGATGQVAVSVAPVTATNTATVVDLRPDSPGIITLGPATTANSVSHVTNSQYPANSATTTPTPLVAKSTGTTSAVTGTITPAATATAYLCGFDVSYIGGTAAVGPITVTGLLGGTWTYQLDVASATVGKTFSKEFNMCVPASAVNTAISVVTTADGTATAVDVQLHGYGL